MVLQARFTLQLLFPEAMTQEVGFKLRKPDIIGCDPTETVTEALSEL